MTKIAKGRQGDWFATAKTGETLPCLKAQFLGARGEYYEPKHYDPSQRKNVEYIDAIKRGRALVAVYKNEEGKAEKRDGYLGGIYTLEDVRHDENGLRCRIVSREKIG
jgi:hypothetical protein